MSRSTTWLPMNPEPPVRKTFRARSPSNLSAMVSSSEIPDRGLGPALEALPGEAEHAECVGEPRQGAGPAVMPGEDRLHPPTAMPPEDPQDLDRVGQQEQRAEDAVGPGQECRDQDRQRQR